MHWIICFRRSSLIGIIQSWSRENSVTQSLIISAPLGIIPPPSTYIIANYCYLCKTYYIQLKFQLVRKVNLYPKGEQKRHHYSFKVIMPYHLIQISLSCQPSALQTFLSRMAYLPALLPFIHYIVPTFKMGKM